MKFITAFFITAMVVIQGCGYTTKSALKPEWKSLYVAPIVNDIDFTNQYERNLYAPMLEVKVRNALTERFLRDGYLKIVNQAEDADIVLKTNLKSFLHSPLRYDNDRNVREWRVSIVVSLELEDQRTHETIWSEGGFAGSQDQFRLGSQTSSEDTAVQAAVDDLSQRIVERTIEHW